MEISIRLLRGLVSDKAVRNLSVNVATAGLTNDVILKEFVRVGLSITVTGEDPGKAMKNAVIYTELNMEKGCKTYVNNEYFLIHKPAYND